MILEELYKVVSEKVAEKYEGEIKVQMKPIVKLNVKRTDFTFTKKGNRVGINFDASQLLSIYNQSGRIEDVMTVINSVLSEILHNDSDNTQELNTFENGLRSEEFVLSNVKCMLVNSERNEDFLKGIPHRDFLDLAIVYYCSSQDGKMTSIITNNVIKILGISENKLYNAALTNTDRDFIAEQVCIGTDGMPVATDGLTKDHNAFFVSVTNKSRMKGAGSMLCRNRLQNIAKQLGLKKLMILPSSIHGVMILALGIDCQDINGRIKKVIEEVNSSVVDISGFLSNSVYVYDCDKDEFNFV